MNPSLEHADIIAEPEAPSNISFRLLILMIVSSFNLVNPFQVHVFHKADFLIKNLNE